MKSYRLDFVKSAIKGMIFILFPALSGCLVDYRVDGVTRLRINGVVYDAVTHAPLKDVAVCLESNRKLAGLENGVEVSKTDDRGTISVDYQKKWGYKRNAMEVWGKRKHTARLSIRLFKEAYQSKILIFDICEPTFFGNININTGEVLLRPVHGT